MGARRAPPFPSPPRAGAAAHVRTPPPVPRIATVTHSLAADALRLRGWTLRLLAGGPPLAGPPPAVPAAAWDVFLRGERCALPLRAALGPDGAAALPAPGAAPVDWRAAREAQRGLAGRAQLRRLGQLLVERGWRGIVLKGGALLAAGDVRVDVGDIDLLLPPEQAYPLARLLDARGARSVDPDPWEHSTQDFHLAPRSGGEHELPLEVHFRIPFAVGVDPWRDPRPSGTPGIHRLPPADHLWHVLVHSVDHHLERRGMIREVALLRAALAGCTADEVETVAGRAAAHGSSTALLGVLGMARALAAGRVPADPFPQAAALRYLLASGAAPFAPGTPRGLETTSAAAALVSGVYLRRWFGEASSVVTLPSARGSRWLDQRLPLLALPGRAAWRGTRLALVTLPALRLARAARRLAAAAG